MSHNRVKPAALTLRQRQILALVAEGKADKEIASILNISFATVRYHLTNIFTQKGVHSRVELLAKLLAEAH